MSGNFLGNIKNIYLENYGCATNTHDLEIMLGYLLRSGYSIEENLENADAIIVNTCGVKKPTEDKVLNRLRILRNLEKPIIVAGCLPKINFSKIKSILPDYSAVLDSHSVNHIVEAMDSVNKGIRGVGYFSDSPLVKLGLPENRINELVKIVSIAEGCLGECSYCCTKLARGKLFSFPIERIVDEIKLAVSRGAREIWITGQDTGAYGRDVETKLTVLLERIKQIEGDFKVRIGMMNPNYAKDMLKDLISIYLDQKIYDFLHIPIQSGSDDVLKSMNRPYHVDDVKNVIKEFRHSILDMTISTDIIVGFPSENEEEFSKSIEFIKEVEPDVVNISKFAPRPGTFAAKLTQNPSKTIKKRSKELSVICSDIGLKKNSRFMNSEQIIFFTKRIRKNVYVGRTQNYKKVFVDYGDNLLGKSAIAKITNASPRYLEAGIISEL